MNPLRKNNYLITLLFFTLFILILQQYCYNFFFADDYHLLRYVTDSQNTSSFKEQISLLFDLHNEHRIIFPRLFTLLIYKFFGYIDWRYYNLISLLYYLGICYIFQSFFNKTKLSYWYFVPIPLLLFQPIAHENIYWTISILQQVGNLFWAMLLFWLISNPSRTAFCWSIAVGVILTFTHGNGLFGLIIAGIVLFLMKRKRELTIWSLFVVTIIGIYFFQYKNGQNSNLAESLNHPDMLIRCLLTFWGSIAWQITNHYVVSNIIAACLGLIIVGTLTLYLGNYLLVKLFKNNQKTDDRNIFLLACFGYLLITSVLVGLSRGWIGISAGLDNRYAHNSLWAISLLYLTILININKNYIKTINLIAFVGAIFINFFAWYSASLKLKSQYDNQRAESFNYRNHQFILKESPVFNHNISTTLAISYQKGISKYTDTELDVLKSLPNSQVKIYTDKTYRLRIIPTTTVVQDAHHPATLQSFLVEALNIDYNPDTFLMLFTGKNNYLIPVEYTHSKKSELLLKAKYYGNGFYSTFVTSNLPKGKYQYAIVQKNDKTYKIALLEQFLEI